MASRSKSMYPPRRIVVAVDGSENSRRAAQAATTLAKQNGSELIVLAAVTSRAPVATSSQQTYIPEIDSSSDHYLAAVKQANQLVREIAEQAEKEGVHVRGLVDRSVSSVVEAILNVAKTNHADLIVIGTRGLGGFKRMLLGSVSSGVVSHADCSVLVVR